MAATNTVAARHGLECAACDAGHRMSVLNDDVDLRCERCNDLIRIGNAVFAVESGYESPEASYYCSKVCASDRSHAGKRSYFLELLGWDVDWCTDQWKWVKYNDSCSRIAFEGDDVWKKDVKLANLLVKQVNELLACPVSSSTPMVFMNFHGLKISTIPEAEFESD